MREREKEELDALLAQHPRPAHTNTASDAYKRGRSPPHHGMVNPHPPQQAPSDYKPVRSNHISPEIEQTRSPNPNQTGTQFATSMVR